MATEFGRGVLDDGPRPPGPEARPTPPPVRRPVARPRRPRSPWPWFLTACGKVLVLTVVAAGTLLSLALLGRLPDGVQDSMADAAEDFGLDLPRPGDPAPQHLPGTGGVEPWTPPTIEDQPFPTIDVDDLYVDPPTIDVPVTPPPVPAAPSALEPVPLHP